MVFKRITNETSDVETPEQLFADLRSRKILGLLAQQADILRDYVSVVDTPDVALQLPTGSGKTLVGLLIAEWRRRKLGEPVAYFCPTKQLVHQVVAQSQTYGMRVVPLVGKQSAYDPVDSASYLSGKAVAITTYSALFNVNSFYDSANTLVFDDAHAAENYVAKHWSLTVSRRSHQAMFDAIANVIGRTLTSTDLQRLTDPQPWDRGWCDLVPMAVLQPLAGELTAVLREHVQETELRFSWSVLEGHLDACQLYIAPHCVLLRPFIPPTATHAPFVRARQRLYMSATLGEGGELERLWGREKIHRLATPPGWETRGIGRRFFMFPNVALKDEDSDDVLVDLVNDPPRALVLVPDNEAESQAKAFFASRTEKKIFSASELESTKLSFIESEAAIAIAANRYDGLDLTADECRLLIVSGLPQALNLQEKFLVTRVGANVILQDRIVTRVTQAVGRCTRGDTDYAAVVVVGSDITKLFLDAKFRRQLHPEMQAEVEFGLQQSDGADGPSFLDNLQIFLEHDERWQAADAELISMRAGKQKQAGPEVAKLRASVASEVKYQYALWRADPAAAIAEARTVLAQLNGDEVRAYRAFWNYLAGTAASSGVATTPRLIDTAKDFYGRAASNAVGISWLARLRDIAGPAAAHDARPNDPLLWRVIERLEENLDAFGLATSRRFDKEEREILGGIASNDSVPFENAHERLGRLLGYDAGNDNGDAAPDPWWTASDKLCFVFEDHTNVVDVDAPIGANKVRQACSHPNWIKERVTLATDAECIAILASPRRTLTPGAAIQSVGLSYWNLDEFREWARTALRVVRELSATYTQAGDLAWRAEAAAKYEQHSMSPGALRTFLSQHLLKSLPIAASGNEDEQ